MDIAKNDFIIVENCEDLASGIYLVQDMFFNPFLGNKEMFKMINTETDCEVCIPASSLKGKARKC